MSFLAEDEFEMKLTSNGTTDASMSIEVPNSLVQNLQQKRMYASSLYVNNTTLPIFIPKQGSQSYLDCCTTDVQSQLTKHNTTFTMNYLNSTLNVNSLGYYVMIVKRDWTTGCINFIQHMQQDSRTTPPYKVPTDETDFCTNKYYWYYNFAHFLKIVEGALNDSCVNVMGSNMGDPYVYMTTDGKSSSMLVRDDVASMVYIFISDSLKKILPYNSSKFFYSTAEVVNDTEVQTTLLNSIYDVYQCNFYDTICPFECIMLETPDFPCRYLTFTTLSKQNVSMQYNKVFLKYLIEGRDLSQVYNNFTYNVSEPIPYVYFTQKEVSQKKRFSVSAFARMKNDVVIPIKLADGERFIINWKVQILS